MSDTELDAVRVIEHSGGVEDTLEPFFAGAQDARPVREVRVEPFLIARHPLTVAQVRHWLPEYEDSYTESDTATARLEDDLDDLVGIPDISGDRIPDLWARNGPDGSIRVYHPSATNTNAFVKVIIAENWSTFKAFG
ncbi:hypothetical protein [Micromonospora sp. NBC_01796]|uniref:hypothetical protein n=1 Tax=Micromonospora sp. NBC_01796 TaxID=2975987 RepID=UPI002DD9704C|nr:hypothetical protein [Micromonospora sp. NBC_01796]WSA83996.1 hypothetical protein OIE47_27030 [Micromonospora sp. NBC_01796]